MLSLFVAPLVSVIPIVATAPALIIIGVMMMSSVVDIDWTDLVIAIPAFLTIVFMPFAFSITTGIQVGFFFYIVTKVFTGKSKEVHPIIYVFTMLFIVDFLYKAIG